VNVERVIRMPAASPVPAVVEVVILEPRPGRFRGWIARILIRLAGRVAGMRVRIVPGVGR
jgi:hypothetical protein